MSVAPNIELRATIQEVDVEGKVHRILLDKGDQKNAFSGDTYAEIRDGILHAYDDERVEAVVIESGGDVFASGGDLKHFLDLLESDEPGVVARIDAYLARVPFRAALRCPKPVICVVDGACMAGGLCLAMSSDIVIATRRATFSVPEARVGVFDAWITELLPLVVGLSRARYLATTCATIDAETAERWGIVACLVDDAPAADEALANILRKIRGGSPEVRALYKRGMTAHVPHADQLETFRVGLTRNGQEGLRAFRDKRQPEWAPLNLGGLI